MAIDKMMEGVDAFADGYEQGYAWCRIENERLRAALQPFAAAANDADGYPDDHPIGCDPAMPLEGQGPLTVGELRRARAALEPELARLNNDREKEMSP